MNKDNVLLDKTEVVYLLTQVYNDIGRLLKAGDARMVGVNNTLVHKLETALENMGGLDGLGKIS